MIRSAIVSVLTAAVTAITAGLVFAPNIQHPYRLEITVVSSTAGEARVYYDRGRGLSEQESGGFPIEAGTNQLRFALPVGTFNLLRLDPVNSEAQVSISDAQLVAFGGRLVRELPASQFTPVHQLTETGHDARFRHFTTTPGANDPQLSITFNPPLPLLDDWPQKLQRSCWWIATCFASILAGIALLWAIWRLSHRWRGSAWDFAHRRPRAAIALCALAAAVTASYPVVFFGRSFVSPNNGALLLYDGSPTVPDQRDTQRENVHGADVNAMMWQHLPYTVVQHRSLNAGELPLWNRYNAAGSALFAQGQSMFGDPLHLLVIAAGGASWAFDIKFLLVRALFACGVGWCVWALSRDLAASFIASFASAFVSFFNYRICHPEIFSLCYSPWVLVGCLHVIQATDARALRRALGLWFLANWMLITSGTVKEAYLLSASLNITGGLAFLLTPAGPGKWRRGAIIAGAAIAFLLASAPGWATFLDTLAASFTTYQEAQANQIPRSWMLAVFDDIFYRAFNVDFTVNLPAANLIVLLGCLCAAAEARRLRKAPAAFATAIGALFAISVAFEWVPESWIVQVPFLKNVHHIHSSISTIVVVYLCIVAGWGFSAARSTLAAGRGFRLGLIVIGLFAFLVIVFFAHSGHDFWSRPGGAAVFWPMATSHILLFVYLALFLLAVPLLIWTASRLANGRPFTGPITAVAGVTVLLLLGRHGQHVGLHAVDRYFPVPGSRENLFATSPAVELLQRETAAEPGRIFGLGNSLFSGWTSAYGLEGINGPDGLQNRHLRELVEAAKITTPGIWRLNYLFPQQLSSWRPILDFLNVRFVGGMPGILESAAGYDAVARLDMDIFRSRSTWPRAFFTDRIQRYDTVGDLVARIYRAPMGEPFAAIQNRDWSDVAEHLPSPAEPAAQPTTATPARDYKLQPNTTAFTVTATGPGLIVLHECWLPDDFRVTVNGREAPYFRVNHAFKAVAVTAAGDYRVAFTYWPQHFTLLLVGCAVGVIAFAALLVGIPRLTPFPLSPRETAPSSAPTLLS